MIKMYVCARILASAQMQSKREEKVRSASDGITKLVYAVVMAA